MSTTSLSHEAVSGDSDVKKTKKKTDFLITAGLLKLVIVFLDTPQCGVCTVLLVNAFIEAYEEDVDVREHARHQINCVYLC